MITWQTEPNAHHYTKDKIYCNFCKKQIPNVFEIKNHLICNNCWSKGLHNTLFKENEEVYIRFIQDILYDKRKNIIKKERGILTPKLRYQIFKRDGFQCVLCGAMGKEAKLEIDHIIPTSKGGKTIKSNLRILCFNCNRGKGNESEN